MWLPLRPIGRHGSPRQRRPATPKPRAAGHAASRTASERLPRTVGTGMGGKSHRTGEDDSAEVRVISDEQIGEEGGLFQGIGAVSDNHSFNPGPKTAAHLTGDAEHVRRLQGRAGYSFEVKRLR